MKRNVFSVAPMLDWTDRHCRYFLRLISKHSLLYTEMVTTSALLHGNRDRLLAFHPAEKPLAIQLGGNHPHELAACAKMAQDYGFDEVNLNVGCPSDRVAQGKWGAYLMKEPDRVAECISAMRCAVSIPVTVKTRIGVDDHDSYEHLAYFVTRVAAGGCQGFIIHARKAWLKGLSPKQNRDIPPLQYDTVARIKSEYPSLTVIVNGGISGIEEATQHLLQFDGVMVGRSAYHNPYGVLSEVDRQLFGDYHPIPSRRAVIEALLPYLETELASGTRLHAITRHILGLFYGQPGGRIWRRYLSEHTGQVHTEQEVLDSIMWHIPQQAEEDWHFGECLPKDTVL